MLAKIKLNRIESKVSEALINNEYNHEDFMTIINEAKNYRELKESIRIMNIERNVLKKLIGLKKVKKIGIDEVIKRNEIINDSLILKYKIVSSYCLKCGKNTQSIDPVVSKASNGKTMILSKCALCGSKKSRFIKKQEASGC